MSEESNESIPKVFVLYLINPTSQECQVPQKEMSVEVKISQFLSIYRLEKNSIYNEMPPFTIW